MMTPEEQAKQVCRLGHSDHPCVQCEAIADALRAAAEAEREACCAALCPHCKNGVPVVFRRSGAVDHVHKQGKEYWKLSCRAAALRVRGKGSAGA